MTGADPYELVVAPPAARAIQVGLPEAVAAAVIEFLTGALIADPRRVGKPLRGDLAGIHSARGAPTGSSTGSTTPSTKSSYCASTTASTSTASPEP